MLGLTPKGKYPAGNVTILEAQERVQNQRTKSGSYQETGCSWRHRTNTTIKGSVYCERSRSTRLNTELKNSLYSSVLSPGHWGYSFAPVLNKRRHLPQMPPGSREQKPTQYRAIGKSFRTYEISSSESVDQEPQRSPRPL